MSWNQAGFIVKRLDRESGWLVPAVSISTWQPEEFRDSHQFVEMREASATIPGDQALQVAASAQDAHRPAMPPVAEPAIEAEMIVNQGKCLGHRFGLGQVSKSSRQPQYYRQGQGQRFETNP